MTRPDDWHVHLRDGAYLKDTVADISRYLGRAIVMPNLESPIESVVQAGAYRDRITSLVPSNASFSPLMSIYLTDATTPTTVVEASESDFVHAIKLYPAGVTTNSSSGVSTVEHLYPVFEAMEESGMVLAIHGEVSDSSVDIFDREKVFIDRHLRQLAGRFRSLKIVFEHITTQEAVDFVTDSPANIGATITAHHLIYNRNHLLSGRIRPIYYCLPVLKRDTHQRALVAAATSGNASFFLGSDSAPHPRTAKEDACGCAAGAYTAHATIELYAEVFDGADALDRLEGFASHYGADFYGLPRNSDRITLRDDAWRVPSVNTLGADQMIPVRAGEEIGWSVDPQGVSHER